MKIEGVNDLGTRVRARRKELKLSQADLCKRVGIAQPSLHNFEKGQTRRSAYALEIITALDMWPEILEALDVRLRRGS